MAIVITLSSIHVIGSENAIQLFLISLNEKYSQIKDISHDKLTLAIYLVNISRAKDNMREI
jgi:hypothetical protein